MKYYEVNFMISAPENVYQDVCDVVAAIAGEAGFETFEETSTGLKGYVQQDAFDADLLNMMLSSLPFQDASVNFDSQPAENRNWNEQWEQKGFAPICIGEHLIIYERQHVPQHVSDQFMVEIDAHQAFGTGNHETTRLMVEALMHQPLEGKNILDCGTGTGILSIVALLRGAQQAVGYDIDEWSVENARHNAVLNKVSQRFTSILGNSIVIEQLKKRFDLVLANINRNILLADLPRMRQAMKPTASLLLSGFYLEDIPLLTTKAKELGLVKTDQKSEGQWALIELKPEM